MFVVIKLVTMFDDLFCPYLDSMIERTEGISKKKISTVLDDVVGWKINCLSTERCTMDCCKSQPLESVHNTHAIPMRHPDIETAGSAP